MADLTWQAWVTLVTLIGVVYFLFSGRVTSDLATAGGLGVLLLTGTVSLDEALQGFSNRAVLTIGLLFVVAALLRNSGALDLVAGRLFAQTKSLRVGLARMMIPTAVVSAFLNNTPVVALLLPAASGWAERNSFSPTKVLIPLSYAAILGGVCTLIGTSTNLVVNGLLQEAGHPGVGFFDVGFIGLPIAITGVLFLATLGPRLLPESAVESFENPATFTTEAIVRDEGKLVGTALADAQVGDLHGLFPVEIRRGNVLIPAPQPDLVLLPGDRLVLAGAAAQFARIHRSDDLITATDHQFDITPSSRRRVVEVVLSDHCPLVGHEVGDGTFRRHYGAAVIALSRGGDPVPGGEVGEWNLRVGDRLLLEAGDGFESHRDSLDFFVVTELPHLDEAAPTWRSWMSLFVAAAMVLMAATQIVPLFHAAIAAVACLLLLNPTSGTELRNVIDWQVILTIASAFGIAAAVQSSGLAGVVASTIVKYGAATPWVALGAVYLATFLLTEVITNNAAAALSFPLALAVSSHLQVDPTPFAIAVMIAASASFMSPLGYQTNLMVYGAGNYHMRDFLRAGWPMALISAAFGIGLTPLIFPF